MIRSYFSASLLSLALAASSQAAVIQINVGADGTPTTTAAPINLVGTQDSYLDNGQSGGPLSIDNLQDTEGNPTGIGVVFDGFNGRNSAGLVGTGDAAIFGAQLDDSLYGNAGNFGGGVAPNPTVTFSGLDANATYDIVFSASRNNVGDTREGTYTFTGGGTPVVTLFDASNNSTRVGTASGLTADANGQLLLSMTVGPNNNNGTTRFFYLGALQITETVNAPVPEPGSFALASLGGLLMLKRRR